MWICTLRFNPPKSPQNTFYSALISPHLALPPHPSQTPHFSNTHITRAPLNTFPVSSPSREAWLFPHIITMDANLVEYRQPSQSTNQSRQARKTKIKPSVAQISSTSTSKPLSFSANTVEDDDGNVLELDEAVEKIGIGKKEKKIKGGGFQGMDLAPEVYQGIKSMGFNVPTPIQRQAIPILLEGADVVAMARTGSGKTAAFAIPLLHRLATNKRLHVGGTGSRGVRAVVLSPTRELAQQTHKVICQLATALKYRIIMLIGGQALSTQFELLSNSPDIIVATPGRLVHHLLEVQFSLQSVEFCVFDEADRLFEMGFAQQLYEILKRMNENRQTALFSATMPQALIEFSRAGLKSPVSVRLDSESKLSPDLQLSFFSLKSQEKNAALLYILRSILPKNQQCMVFVSTRHHVDFLVSFINHSGLSAVGIYGLMDADSRTTNIEQFRQKKFNILVVTDLAARGIDIPLLDNVLHYDFPTQPKLFIHRSGRVARAGQRGTAFCLVSPDDMPYLIDLYLFFAWRLPFNLPTKATDPNDPSFIAEQRAAKKEGVASADADDDDDDDAADDDNDDNDSRLNNRDEQMDRKVEFGSIPTSLLDFEVEHANGLIKANDLERLVSGCDNAYEKYCLSKGKASRASGKKWKEIRGYSLRTVIDIHPWFLSQNQTTVDESGKVIHDPNSIRNMITAERAKDLLAAYTPSQTVFELYNKSSDIIQEKRRLHDRVIVDKNGLDAVVGLKLARAYEAEQELLAQSRGEEVKPKHTIKVMRKVESDEKVFITVADRRKRKLLDEKYKDGKLSTDEYVTGLRELPSQLQTSPIERQETQSTLSAKAIAPVANKTASTPNPAAVDFSTVSISRSDRPPSLAFLKGPLKRPSAVLDHDTEVEAPEPTKLVSKADILAKLAASAASQLDIKAAKPVKRLKRGQLSEEERRDSQYISLTPSGNRYEEMGLSLGNSRLEDMALELNAEDGEGRRVQQKTRKWSETSKKFVTIYSSKDAFGKVVTNEAGQKVNKNYVVGTAYADWRRSNRKLEAVVDMDDDDKSNQSAAKGRVPTGKKSLQLAKNIIDEDGGKKGFKKGTKFNKSSKNVARSDKNLGIRSTDELIKDRRKSERHKSEARRGEMKKKAAMKKRSR